MSCECGKNTQDAEASENTVDRRSFLTRIVLGIGSFMGLAMAFPLVTSMLDPVTRKTGKKWRSVGDLDTFKVGETRLVTFKNASPYSWSGQIKDSAAYVRREEGDRLVAFSVNCSHLGCPVRWEEEPKLFLCPCHGGVYYKDGSRAAGPPPRGLYKYPARVRKGKVEIQTEAIPITDLSA